MPARFSWMAALRPPIPAPMMVTEKSSRRWLGSCDHSMPRDGTGPLLVPRFNYYMARAARVGTTSIYYPAGPGLPTMNRIGCDSATHRGEGWVMLLCGSGG